MRKTTLYFALAAGLLSASPAFAQCQPDAYGVRDWQCTMREIGREQDAEAAADRRAQKDRDAAALRQGIANMEAASRAEKEREAAEFRNDQLRDAIDRLGDR